MQIRIFELKKSPNIRKNIKNRQRISPAIHITVAAHPISSGIIKKVTSKSAMAKWINNRLTRDLVFLYRRIRINMTLQLQIELTTNRKLQPTMDMTWAELNCMSKGNSVVLTSWSSTGIPWVGITVEFSSMTEIQKQIV